MKCTFIIQNNGYSLLSKIKKMKTERESTDDFIFLSLCFVFDNMKNLCTLSLYANKVQEYDCLYEKQKGGDAYIILSKGTLHFKYVFKE